MKPTLVISALAIIGNMLSAPNVSGHSGAAVSSEFVKKFRLLATRAMRIPATMSALRLS